MSIKIVKKIRRKKKFVEKKNFQKKNLPKKTFVEKKIVLKKFDEKKFVEKNRKHTIVYSNMTTVISKHFGTSIFMERFA